MQRDVILKAFYLSLVLTVINVVIGILWSIMNSTSQISSIATGLGFLELALFLIIGACLLARDPIDKEDRFDEVGMPNTRFKMVLFGQVLTISAILLFLFMGVLFIVGGLFNF